MEIKNETLKVSFVFPDKLTIRQRLQYDSYAYGIGPRIENLWQAARAVIQDWKCDEVPLDVDLDKQDDIHAVDVIEWVGRAVFSQMFERNELPKNS